VAGFFPAYDDAVFKHHLPTLEPEVFDSALGLMVITYQTVVVRFFRRGGGYRHADPRFDYRFKRD
jgi:hypothetical protein